MIALTQSCGSDLLVPHVAGQKTIDCLVEKRLAKVGVVAEPFPHGNFEIAGQWHRLIPFAVYAVSLASVAWPSR